MRQLRASYVLAPLDAVRAAFYRALGPSLGRYFRDRALRTSIIGSISVTVAFALTATAPLWLLALGPLLLGVPHLLADVRYLVVRPKLHQRATMLVLAAPPMVAMSLGARASVGAVTAVVMVACARESWVRRALMIAVLASTALAMQLSGRVGDWVFAHVHNLVALAIWWAWRPRSAKSSWPLALFVAGTIAILAGAAEPIMSRLGAFVAPATGLDLWSLTASTGRVASPEISLRLLLWFAFAQSVHYAVWLRLVPEDARERQAPRGFGSSAHALIEELGAPLFLLFVVGALIFIVWSVFSIAHARDGYLRVAASHGWLEVGAIALALVERRRLGEPLTAG